MSVSCFLRVWCLSQALSVSWHWPRQRKFYRWFSESKLSESRRRGLSTYGYPLLGLVQIPKLSELGLELVTSTYQALLLAASLGLLGLGEGAAEGSCGGSSPQSAAAPVLAPAGLLCCCLYHGSLWAERASSHHREILSVTLWLYLCLAPELCWAIWAFRVHLASVYTASVAQKLLCSLLQGSWPRWSPHGFLWKAMWAKPWFPKLQRFVFLRPSLAHVAGWMSLFVELGPLLSLFMPQVQRLSYAALMVMHLAVLLLQGIDYVSYWTPGLLVGILAPPLSLSATAWDLSDWNLLPMMLFLGAQICFALTMAENFNVNLPPLMSCPMFVTIARLDDKFHQHYVMTLDGEIPYERVEWMYPFVRPEYGIGLRSRDVPKFPMPFVAFGWGGEIPQQFRVFAPHFKKFSKGFYLVTNVPRFPRLLRLRLRRLVRRLHGPQPQAPQGLRRRALPVLAAECAAARRAFERHARRAERCKR